MRLLIVEPEAEGHHLVLYTRLILKEATDRGWEVTILTTESGRRHDAFAVLAEDHGGELQTIVIPDLVAAGSMGSLALLAAQLRLWKALARACNANNGFGDFDLIYCINLDYFEKALSLRGSPFGSRPFAGMLMNPKFHRAPAGLGPPSRGDSLYRFLFKRLLAIKTLARLMVIDEPFQSFCTQQGLLHADKICLVSDVGELSGLESRDSARDTLGIPRDAFVVLIYGSLSRRKGVEQLLRAVQHSEDNKVHALVAGKPDPAIAALLSSSWCEELRDSGRLSVRAEFHDDESEARVFSAADIVWLGYVGGAYGSSGVLYQAGSAGLPVLSMAEGLVGWAVKTHKLGISLDASDESEVVEAIQLLYQDEMMRRECGENGRRLAESHTGAAFAATICDGLAASIAESREL
jgi:glycosyltransferase involved in cell wall biosynthesis